MRLLVLVSLIVSVMWPALPVQSSSNLQPEFSLASSSPVSNRKSQPVKPPTAGSPDVITDTQAITPGGTSPDWWPAVMTDIQQSEYDITWQDHTYLADVPATYQAPNRAQNLRAYFTPEGVRVIPRTEVTPTWELDLSLIGVGDSAKLPIASSVELTASTNRVEAQARRRDRMVRQQRARSRARLHVHCTASVRG